MLDQAQKDTLTKHLRRVHDWTLEIYKDLVAGGRRVHLYEGNYYHGHYLTFIGGDYTKAKKLATLASLKFRKVANDAPRGGHAGDIYAMADNSDDAMAEVLCMILAEINRRH